MQVLETVSKIDPAAQLAQHCARYKKKSGAHEVQNFGALQLKQAHGQSMQMTSVAVAKTLKGALQAVQVFLSVHAEQFGEHGMVQEAKSGPVQAPHPATHG